MRLADVAASLPPWQPMARLDHLVVNEVGDEVLVYDQTTHAIHHLNAASTTVWRGCDGHTPVAGIAMSAGLTEETVRMALAKLADAGLLTTALPAALGGAAQSRRTFMKKAAIAGTIPAIVSVTAPLAAQAQSLFFGTCTRIFDTISDCSGAPSCCTQVCESSGGTVIEATVSSCETFEDDRTVATVNCVCARG